MSYYLETSAILAGLLDGDVVMLERLHGEILEQVPHTSALTFVEAIRSVRRARAERRISSERESDVLSMVETLRSACAVFALTPAVLHRAEQPFADDLLRSLDALHVATAAELRRELGGEWVVFATDQRVRRAAAGLGFRLEPSDLFHG